MNRHHAIRLAFGIVVALTLSASTAQAQYFPGGYGRYGWGGWGFGYPARDPNPGFMRSIGYLNMSNANAETERAKAKSIEIDNIVKWNKAVRENQRILKAEQAKKEAKEKAAATDVAKRTALENGDTLNDLFDRIAEFPTSDVRNMMSQTTLSASAIKEIPFEVATEAMTFCLNQLIGRDSWPPTLASDRFTAERNALQAAVRKALSEDGQGMVSKQTQKEVETALGGLRKKFEEKIPDYDPGYSEADEFLRTLYGLNKMLHTERYRELLGKLDTYKGGTLLDLVAFMHSFNLRFGAAMTDRQKEVYRSLAPMLTELASESEAVATASAVNPKAMTDAARKVFEGMSWKDLESTGK